MHDFPFDLLAAPDYVSKRPSLLWRIAETAICDFTFTSRQNQTLAAVSVQPQITLASFGWLRGSFWPLRSLFCSVSRLQLASLLTPVPLDDFCALDFPCPGPLAVRQRHRRDHSQYAAEQPPTQVPFGQQKPVTPRMLHQSPASL
jgi:hypothetical protein